MKYRVPVYYERTVFECGWVTVEADSIEDAKEKAIDKANGEGVDGNDWTAEDADPDGDGPIQIDNDRGIETQELCVCGHELDAHEGAEGPCRVDHGLAEAAACTCTRFEAQA